MFSFSHLYYCCSDSALSHPFPAGNNLMARAGGGQPASSSGFQHVMQGKGGPRSTKRRKFNRSGKKGDRGAGAETPMYQNGGYAGGQTSSNVFGLGAFSSSQSPPSVPANNVYFWDAGVDGPVIAALMRLDRSHWGLKCTLFAMLSAAVHKQSFPLLSKFCSLVAHLGIVSMQEFAPLYGVHPLATMTTTTLHLDADFNASLTFCSEI